MTIQRFIYLKTISLLEKLLQSHKFSKCYSSNLSIAPLKDDNQNLDIVSVAFNNEQIIEHQIRLIKKYIQGDYNYIVADNSSNKEIQQKIKNICEKNNISYIILPPNHLNLIGPSYSHSASLNWIYNHIIKQRKAKYFGFIDHDLFPIAPFNLKNKMLDQPIYGLKRDRNEGRFWYLWAGLCFFNSGFLRDKKVNFMPCKIDGFYLDSGGSNWKTVYSSLNDKEISFVPERMSNIRKGDSRHGDKVEFFDDCWLHTINGSYWKKVEKKEDILDELLKNY